MVLGNIALFKSRLRHQVLDAAPIKAFCHLLAVLPHTSHLARPVQAPVWARFLCNRHVPKPKWDPRASRLRRGCLGGIDCPEKDKPMARRPSKPPQNWSLVKMAPCRRMGRISMDEPLPMCWLQAVNDRLLATPCRGPYNTSQDEVRSNR